MEEKDRSVGKPEEEESGQPELREISPEELKKVLEEHEKWLDLRKKGGKQPNLREASVRGANLREGNLGEADFRAANLRGALNLTPEQLPKVKTLYEAKLDEKLEKQIKERYPLLLEKPKED